MKYRWECRCGTPPILLALYNPVGSLEIKMRDRYYSFDTSHIEATCPRCGAQHVLCMSSIECDEGPCRMSPFALEAQQ